MAESTVRTILLMERPPDTEIYGEILDERAKEEYEKYGPDIEIEL